MTEGYGKEPASHRRSLGVIWRSHQVMPDGLADVDRDLDTMIEFRTLGAVDLRGSDEEEVRSILERPKLLGLLSFLAARAPGGFLRRDTLLTLFWADVDQDRARRALRQSIYYLRQALGERVLLGRGEDEVGLSSELFWSDVAAFDEAVDRGDREEALALYRGEFLQGFFVSNAPEFERWLDERRGELRERAARTAWQLAEASLDDRNPTVAAHWGRRAVRHAPFDERLLRGTIKLLDRVGDRAGAIREYEAFARRLGEELELEPSPETRALVEEVRARSQTPPDRVTASPAEAIVGEAQDDPAEPTVPSEPPARSPPRTQPFDTRPTVDLERLRKALAERYLIESPLGSGGMATVYRAHDVRHDRSVAVKVMHPDLAATLGADRFLREIKIAAKLTHPHIVPLYDSGLTEGFLYYVMPHITGESLQQRLDRDGQLPLDEALGIARDVADALGHAHSLDVVHRDVKPANILLSGGHAWVADFGVACAVSAASEVKLTAFGMAVGTPMYMSPEQAAGTGEIDGRSDVYSLGCVLYEMIVGTPPFTAESLEELVGQHRTTPPRPVVALRPAVPASIGAAVGRALEKRPGDRYGTAEEFAAALASPHAKLPKGWRIKRRVKRYSLVAAAVVVLALIGVFLQANRRPGLDPNRVVVVPLENRTGDTDLAVFGNMAADWITQGLQEVGVIDVVSSTSALGPGPVVVDAVGSERVSHAAAIDRARAAGAGTVVVGAFYQSGDSLEFQAQVVDAGDGDLLRAVEPVSGPVGAPGDAIDTLRQRVVGALARMRDPRLARFSVTAKPPAPEAYRQYLEGYREFYRITPTGYPQGQRAALPYLYRAVEIDSNFLDPRFLLVWAHSNLGELALADSNARLLIPHRPRLSTHERHMLDWQLAGLSGDRQAALEAARALGEPVNTGVEALRANRPREAIEALGGQDLTEEYFPWLTLLEALHMVGDHRGELREARSAREEYPDHLRMLTAEVRALAAMGRIEDVRSLLDESLLLQETGVYPVGTMLAASIEFRRHGYPDAAVETGERGLEWFLARPEEERTSSYFRASLAGAYYQLGRWDEARHLYEELAAEDPGAIEYQGFLGVLAARRGDRDEALRISEHLRGMNDAYDFARDLYWQACIAAQLGELERAMVLLRDAYAGGRAFNVWLHRDMDLEPLHGYPPFEEFLEPKG